MKKKLRSIVEVSIYKTESLMSASTDGEPKRIHLINNGSGYVAFIPTLKKRYIAKTLGELFEDVFEDTHKKSYYYDLSFTFPKENKMTYKTFHTGQVEIRDLSPVSEDEASGFYIKCLFPYAKEERT